MRCQKAFDTFLNMKKGNLALPDHIAETTFWIAYSRVENTNSLFVFWRPIVKTKDKKETCLSQRYCIKEQSKYK